MLNHRFLIFGETWRKWTITANQNEEGWQTDFPDWSSLIEEAARVMTREVIDPSELSLLVECWIASEEDEELLERLRGQVDDCWKMMETLATLAPPACRWQLYEVASTGNSKAEMFLRNGLNDTDSYARRRAILSLARRNPDDAQKLAETLMIDSDPYIRQAAVEMIIAAKDEAFKMRALRTLMEDNAPNVRNAARHYMSPP